jgi:hypothetical protein
MNINVEPGRDRFIPSPNCGCTHTFERGSSKICCVCLPPPEKGGKIHPGRLALLAHEAVHVYNQMLMEYAGLEDADELSATSIGEIYYNLLQAYTARSGGSLKLVTK